MSERESKATRDVTGGPASGFWQDAAGQAGSQQLVTVASGIYQERFPVAGMTVAQVRQRMATRLDVAPGAEAFVDGHPAGEDTVLRGGEVLLFMHQHGEKGRPA